VTSSVGVIRQQLDGRLWADLIGLASLALACSYMVYRSVPHADPVALGAWAVSFSVILINWMRQLLAERALPQILEQHVIQIWSRSVFGVVVINVWIALAVWVMLPGAPVETVDAFVALYGWYILTFALVANEAVESVRWTILLVVASLVGFLLIYPPHGERVIALVIAVMGLSAMALQQLIRRATVRATEAQLQAEAAQAELAAALEQVSAQRDARARFMASVSHDLQQPLQAAQMMFELACQDNSESGARIARSGRAAFSSVGSLLEQMLDFMRLSSGLAIGTRQRQTVSAALSLLIEQYRIVRLGSPAIRFVPSSAMVEVDPLQLHRTVGNLIENAILHAGAKRVLVGVTRRAGTVRLWVIDDGVGVSTDLRPTLFDPYVRGAPASGAHAGFGLGLASAHVLADAMGGVLKLEQDTRRGAAFSLELPAANEIVFADLDEEADRCSAA
jgi:signal transduction histidine kinase